MNVGAVALPRLHPTRSGDELWNEEVVEILTVIKRLGGPKEPEKDTFCAGWSPPSGRTFRDAGAFRPPICEVAR